MKTVNIQPRFKIDRSHRQWYIFDQFEGQYVTDAFNNNEYENPVFDRYHDARICCNQLNDQHFELVKWALADRTTVMQLDLD